MVCSRESRGDGGILTTKKVEVAPIYDSAGEITTLAAADIIHSLIALMVDTPVEGKL